MRKHTNWIVVTIVAALVAAVIVLVGTAVPGATSKANAAAAATPSPSPIVLQVMRDGAVAKSYTLDQVEALTPLAGFAGYRGGSSHGPDAVTGVKVTDIAKDAFGVPLTAVESVLVAEVPLSTGYGQTFTGAQLLDPKSGFTMMDATTGDTIDPSTLTGTLSAVLVYSDPDLNVMPDTAGPLRFLISDTVNENAVMTGKYSGSNVNEINVTDPVTVTMKARHATVERGTKNVFVGKVKNAVAKDTRVTLRLVKGKKYVALKSGHITAKGAFKLTYKAKKAGKWTFVATYRAGKTTFLSKKVTVVVTK